MGLRAPCAAANPAIASRVQSDALVGRVAELGSLAPRSLCRRVPLIDPVTAEAYLALMNAAESAAELTESGVLRIPADVVAQLPKAGRARIIVLTGDQAEDADWRLGAYAQFLREDPGEDEK